MERWVELYSNLYSIQEIVSPSAVDAVDCLPAMDELDAEPTVEDFSKVIDNLASSKAPCRQRRNPPWPDKTLQSNLLFPLHEIICQCWQERAVPQGKRGAKIITPYKNKGEKRDCNNYREISILSIVGKVFDSPAEAGKTYLP